MKKQVAFFFEKMIILWTPFFKIHLSKIVSRICTLILSSIRIVVLEKNDFFCQKLTIFKK